MKWKRPAIILAVCAATGSLLASIIPGIGFWNPGGKIRDDMESYSDGALVNGRNGGTGWLNYYIDRVNVFLIVTRDDMESYSSAASVDGLSSGFDWSGNYADRDGVFGFYGVDDMESYSDGASVDGLNGNMTLSNSRNFPFAAAYDDR